MALLAHADILKAHLEGVAGLSDCAVLVDRKKDLESEVLTELEKRSGAAIVIGLIGWENVDVEAPGPVLKLIHGISLWAVPTYLESEEMPSFDTLLATLTTSVHRWQPAQVADAYCHRDWEVGNGSLVPHRDILVHEFTATILEDLGNPVTVP